MSHSTRTLFMTTVSIVIVVLCLNSEIFTQNKEWKAISPEDLSVKAPVVDPDADAEALFWEVRIDDSSYDDLDMSHYVRVKIFSERGREKFSKFDIPYVRGMKIKNLAARVIRPDGTISEINEKDIFEREIVKVSGVKVKAKSFAVPNIEPGVIVEYKYKEVIDDVGAVGMRLDMQRDIPVRTLSYYYKPYGKKEPGFRSYNVEGISFKPVEKGTWLVQRTNVPAFKEEPRMPPDDMVRPWIKLLSRRIEIESDNEKVTELVEKLSESIYWSRFAGRQGLSFDFITRSDKDIKRLAEELTANLPGTEMKLRKLFDFCQKQIKNVYYDPNVTAEERKKMPRIKNVSDILKKREVAIPGYVNWLYLSLAKSIGLDARMAFSGNKSKFFFDPSHLNSSYLHFSSIAVVDGNSVWYANPADPFMPFNMVSWFEEGMHTILINGQNFIWTRLPSATYLDNNYSRRAKLRLNENGDLEGDVTVQITGQPAILYRQSYHDDTNEVRTALVSDDVKRRLNSAEVSAITVDNVNDYTKPILQRYKIKVPNFAQKTGKRLFFQPGFFEAGEQPLFSSSERKYDVVFSYAWSEDDEVEIELPANFSVEDIKAPGSVSDSQGIAGISVGLDFDKDKRTIKFNRKFYFGRERKLLFPVKSYAGLKSLFDGFHRTDSHMIALRQN